MSSSVILPPPVPLVPAGFHSFSLFRAGQCGRSGEDFGVKAGDPALFLLFALLIPT
ncbi:hypothetical protein EST38_g12182 [Candolleomyces aberdarensis]|uniref:Uncharacterized protein n=1 Tax=Candolleomyces aberdarensis TaxID=2316362 RepID=A0A4Q2D5N0_9AGAR|nr:hypothetical protein EST38_g12182 [Candolleomyces aberdarensis]